MKKAEAGEKKTILDMVGREDRRVGKLGYQKTNKKRQERGGRVRIGEENQGEKD